MSSTESRDSTEALFARYGPAYRWLATGTALIASISVILSATMASITAATTEIVARSRKEPPIAQRYPRRRIARDARLPGGLHGDSNGRGLQSGGAQAAVAADGSGEVDRGATRRAVSQVREGFSTSRKTAAATAVVQSITMAEYR